MSDRVSVEAALLGLSVIIQIRGAGAIGGYTVNGGSMDYLYDTLKCPFSLTVEVFGQDADFNDCLKFV